MLGDPELLIFDEPTNGLDPEGMQEIRELILKLSRSGRTIVLSTHMLAEVERVCTHVAILKRGRLLRSAAVSELTAGAPVFRLRTDDLPILWEAVSRYPAARQIRREHGAVYTELADADPASLCRSCRPWNLSGRAHQSAPDAGRDLPQAYGLGRRDRSGGGAMIFTAYRLELFKMGKRLAVWVTYLCFLLLTSLPFGGQFYAAQHSHGRSYFGFPNVLPAILTEGTAIASIFGVVLIVLMVCSEFDWKTSRQNIIDGLSKPQWFAGKALLIPTVAAAQF